MKCIIRFFKSETLLSLFIFHFLFSSCSKEPTATFSIEKESYLPGEVVKCINQSKNGVIYKWSGPYGSTDITSNFSYSLHPSIKAGTYSVTLEALNKKGNKSSTVTKTFRVIERDGRLVVGVWEDPYFHKDEPVNVFIKDEVIGVITRFIPGVSGPLACGDFGCITVSLTPGNYEVFASNGITTQSVAVKVERDGCAQAKFTY